MVEIKHRLTGKVIFRVKAKTLRGADLEYTNLRNADLRGAYLMGADLRGTDLSDADLSDADLRGADMMRANLRGANLEDANLRNADLVWANLKVKVPPVNCNRFVSEILYREAKTEAQRDFSARVRIQTGECWGYFIKLARKKRMLSWAKEVLFQWDEFKERFAEEATDAG
jgi:hypothetical protein